MDSRIREDIVDRGIEKGEWEMRNLSKQLHHDTNQEPTVGGAHNSDQMFAKGPEHTDAGSPKDKASPRHKIDKDDIRDRKVDPEAVRESFREAELDPIAENEPEEGENAA